MEVRQGVSQFLPTFYPANQLSFQIGDSKRDAPFFVCLFIIIIIIYILKLQKT